MCVCLWWTVADPFRNTSCLLLFLLLFKDDSPAAGRPPAVCQPMDVMSDGNGRSRPTLVSVKQKQKHRSLVWLHFGRSYVTSRDDGFNLGFLL